MIRRDSSKLVAVAGLVLCFAVGSFAFAQDPVVPLEGMNWDSDWLYRQHYDQVQGIMGLADPAEKEQKLEAYMKKLGEGAKILQYMEAYFGQIVKDYQQAGKTAEAQALLDRVAALFPDSPNVLGRSFQTAFQGRDFQKAIETGEKLYAGNPDPQVLVMLTQSYLAVNNVEKGAEYSKKVVETLGPEKGVFFVTWLGDYHAGKGDVDGALGYYDMALKAYPSGAPEGWDAARWNQIRAQAHMLHGSKAYTAKEYDPAVQHFSEALKSAPQNDAAYLYLGLSYWRLQKLDEAMDAFAKGTVLEKQNSAKAKEYLEQIYKTRNNGSLDGLDQVLAKAKAAVNP